MMTDPFYFYDPFTGFYVNKTTGLDLTWFRAYDPEMGRWLSRDPLAETMGINLYKYVNNDPVLNVDPLGDLNIAEIAGLILIAQEIIDHLLVWGQEVAEGQLSRDMNQLNADLADYAKYHNDCNLEAVEKDARSLQILINNSGWLLAL